MHAVLLAVVFAASAQAVSDVKTDEEVVFFPTYAHVDKDQQHWNIPIHGWVYEPELDSISRGILLALLRRKLGVPEGETASTIFKSRARMFLVDNERGKRMVVRFGAAQLPLDKSAPNGHFRTVVRAAHGPFRTLLQGQEVEDGWCRFQAVLRPDDPRVFEGSVQLIAPTGVSVISDIDDTIKISEVRDHKALVRRTFVEAFEAVPEMAALYRAWAQGGVRFHYVSASPWQLYPALREFIDAEGFPLGSFHLRDLRWKDATLVEFLGSSEKYKLETIERILGDFPQRRFVLVGDSGEKDPEVYGTVARRHPTQVARVFIRNVTDEAADAERFTEAFRDVPPEKWRLFRRTWELTGALPPVK